MSTCVARCGIKEERDKSGSAGADVYGSVVWSEAEPSEATLVAVGAVHKNHSSADVLVALKTGSCEYSILAVKEETMEQAA